MPANIQLPKIERISVKNLLSFGNEGVDIKLEPLNILIGPNASGKSNLLRALSIFHYAPSDISRAFAETDGPEEWPWKGLSQFADSQIAATISAGGKGIGHIINISIAPFMGTQLSSETVLMHDDPKLFPDSPPKVLYDYRKGRAKYLGKDLDLSAFSDQTTTPISRSFSSQSVLEVLKSPAEYAELRLLSMAYLLIGLYRGWTLSADFPPKRSQPTSQRGQMLQADASNLAMVILNLQNHHSGAFKTIEEDLKAIYPGVRGITVDVENNRAIILIHEKGLRKPVPAMLLSDGLLRYLCLLVVLRNPLVSSLIAIEEPEIGLHPDAILHLADILKASSKDKQIIITTHSDILVSQMTDIPEAVIVCERDENGTKMARLEPEKLGKWLRDEYLGQIWLSGGIGGTL